MQRVINTRPLLLKDAQGKHYLHVFDGWMVADELGGQYTPLPSPSADLEKAKKAAIQSRQVDLLTGQSDPKDKIPTLAKPPIPQIHIATAPTELIVTDGAPQWQPIQGTQLLYVTNTTGHIFKEVGDQDSYVLISGRWFKAADLKGPGPSPRRTNYRPTSPTSPMTAPKRTSKPRWPVRLRPGKQRLRQPSRRPRQ